MSPLSITIPSDTNLTRSSMGYTIIPCIDDILSLELLDIDSIVCMLLKNDTESETSSDDESYMFFNVWSSYFD